MAMDAFRLGGAMKALRVGSEEKDRRVGGLSVIEQAEMGEKGLCRGLGLEGESALSAGRLQEPIDAFARKAL